jgi:hypothetical protein
VEKEKWLMNKICPKRCPQATATASAKLLSASVSKIRDRNQQEEARGRAARQGSVMSARPVWRRAVELIDCVLVPLTALAADTAAAAPVISKTAIAWPIDQPNHRPAREQTSCVDDAMLKSRQFA